jgi:enamine deaminase RidA (YjgF/YER057c/UK114 family)
MLGERREIRVQGMAEPISHYTHVVQTGRLVFVSGCVATDGAGTIVGGADAAAQARQVHENLKRYLAAAGATFADVCKVTVFVKNVADREKINGYAGSTSARAGQPARSSRSRPSCAMARWSRSAPSPCFRTARPDRGRRG